MTDNKQYPELPEPGRYYTHQDMLDYVDADRAMRAREAIPYDHGPQAATLEEAVADVGKWLNERPSRPLDLRSVAMLVAAAQQPRDPLSEETLKQMHHEDQFGLFCDYDEFEQIARAIEQAHGIQPAHKEQSND